MNFGNGFDILLLAVAVVVIPAMSAWAGIRLARDAPTSLLPRYGSVILRGWGVAAFVLGLWWAAHRPFRALGLDWPVGMRGQWGFPIDALLLAFFAVQQMRLSRLSPDEIDSLRARAAALKVTPRTPAEFVAFVPVALTAGVWEELLYRGFLIGYLAPRTGLACALLLSSAIFGLGHLYQGWRGFLTTSVVGLAFAASYGLSHSLWWLMVAHALVDVNAGIATFRIADRSRTSSSVKVNENLPLLYASP